MIPEITHFTIDTKTDCAVILACDGIWDVLKDDEAAILGHAHAKCGQERLTKVDAKIPTAQTQPLGGVIPTIKNPAMQAARGINRESFQKYSMDNLTTVVVRMKPMHSGDKKKQDAYMAAQFGAVVKREEGGRSASGGVKKEEVAGVKQESSAVKQETDIFNEPEAKRVKKET